MNDEGRGLDGRHHRPGIVAAEELHVRGGGTRCGRHPLETALAGSRPVGLPVPPQRGGEVFERVPSAPTGFDEFHDSADHRLDLVAAREVGTARDLPGVTGIQHQLVDPFRITRGEDRRHRPSLGEPEQRRPLDLGSVEDGANVVDPLIHRHRHHHAVRHPGAPLVESDQSREGRERLVEPPRQSVLQLQLEMRHPAGDVDEVGGSIAEHLKRDVKIAAARIACLRHRGPRTFTWRAPARQREHNAD